MIFKDIPHSQDELKELLDYNEQTGLLYWKVRKPVLFTDGKLSKEAICAAWNGKNAGKEAFCHIDLNLYKVGRIFNEPYKAHRIIWKLVYGELDRELQINHANGITTDNRLENLEIGTHQYNQKNRSIQHNNPTGYNGVNPYYNKGKLIGYRARARVDGKPKDFPLRKTLEEAIQDREKFNIEQNYHKNHGRQKQ